MEEFDKITSQDIFAVVRHLPVLTRADFLFGEWRTPPGQLPYVFYSPEAMAFIEDASKLILDIDWTAWQEPAMQIIQKPKLLAQADLLTLRKLLTFHLRTERFTEGHLLQMYLVGHLTSLLRRLAQLAEKL